MSASPTAAPTPTVLSTLTKSSAADTTNIFLERGGKFQCILIVLLALNSIIVGINHTITAFHIYIPAYFCRDDPAENCGPYVNGTLCPSGYVFDEKDAVSIAVEWSLVCDKRMLAPLVNTLYFVGVTIGALICSSLCDVWGRRKLVLICMYGQALMAYAQYAAQSFLVFCAFRMMQGFFIQGLQTCTYTLILEYCPSRYRTICSTLWELNWTLGLILLSGASYLIRDWRLLTLVLTIPTILSISYSWMIPESINWLLAKNEIKKAIKLVQKIATFNDSCDIAQQCSSFDMNSFTSPTERFQVMEDETEKTHRFCDIIRCRVLRKHLFTMTGIWFSVTLSYYGILYYLPNLAGERHLNFLVGAIIEGIAYILAYFLLSRLGRRLPMAFYQYGNGVLLLAIGIITTIAGQSQIKEWSLIIITLIAKGLAVSSFCAMFIYCSELLPTVSRGLGLGLCGFSARCGSLIAPQLMSLVYYVPEYIPLTIMAVFLLSAASVTLFLPETLHSRLPNNIEEAEKMWATEN
ncbi:solute carrier family 22 member 6-A-like isoform X2 [Episyrphus balteatus]|uniref:solute carrier family 22 member 6-A-like isoform X2 n=1 Tax=Episyrphus balteatus TaxID=286459 RepID=UPI0024861F4F|nr:solute carrier family 22 member 6-A-like isoform X2 [Episyrphus balteatus]